jgi:hypothetical protein
MHLSRLIENRYCFNRQTKTVHGGKMSNISIGKLENTKKTSGAALFSDPENYMDEMSAQDMGDVLGGQLGNETKPGNPLDPLNIGLQATAATVGLYQAGAGSIDRIKRGLTELKNTQRLGFPGSTMRK